MGKSVWLSEFGPVISHLFSNLNRIMGGNSPLKQIINAINGVSSGQSKKSECWGSKILYTQNDDSTLEKLDISDHAKKVTGYKGCSFLRDKGYRFDPVNGSHTQLAALSAVGQTMNDTRKILDEVSECVRILKKMMRSTLFNLGTSKLLIFGGTGFVGRSILRYLKELSNHSVRIPITYVFTRDYKQFLENWPEFKKTEWLKFLAGDVLNQSTFQKKIILIS